MSSNDGGHVCEIHIGGTIADEMNALDQLGPLTRQVIYDSPIRYSADAVLKHAGPLELRKLPRSMAPKEFVAECRRQQTERAEESYAG